MPDNYIMLLTLGGIIVASLIGLGLYAWWCGAEDKKISREKDKIRTLKELEELIDELKCDINYRRSEIIQMIDVMEGYRDRISAAQQDIEVMKNEISRLEKKINSKVEDDCK